MVYSILFYDMDFYYSCICGVIMDWNDVKNNKEKLNDCLTVLLSIKKGIEAMIEYNNIGETTILGVLIDNGRLNIGHLDTLKDAVNDEIRMIERQLNQLKGD